MANTKTQTMVEKVQKLVALASDGDEDSEEARTAALQAVRLMKEHNLAVIDEDALNKAMKLVEGARDLAKNAKAEGQKQILIGAALGYVFGGGKMPFGK
jgi:phosphoserine phosphatase